MYKLLAALNPSNGKKRRTDSFTPFLDCASFSTPQPSPSYLQKILTWYQKSDLLHRCSKEKSGEAALTLTLRVHVTSCIQKESHSHVNIFLFHPLPSDCEIWWTWATNCLRERSKRIPSFSVQKAGIKRRAHFFFLLPTDTTPAESIREMISFCVCVCARMTGTTTRVACSIFQKKKREANKWKAVTNIFFFNNKKNKQNKQNRINNIQGGTIDRCRPYWIVKLVFYFQLTHVHLQMKRLLNSTRRRSFDLTKDALTRRWMCPCF